jgi:hypothetical protein
MPAKETEVALKDERGSDIGVTVTVAPKASDDQPIEDRITGWSRMEVQDQSYPFSKARARDLLNLFPHYAAQIERAAAKAS